MFRRETLWLLAAFVVGLFLVGLPQWSAQYDRDPVADPLMITGLAGLSVLAMMLLVGRIAPPARTAIAMTLCLPAAALARILIEMGQAPASHLLWPLELASAFGTGAAAVVPGVLAGILTLRLQSRGRG